MKSWSDKNARNLGRLGLALLLVTTSLAAPAPLPPGVTPVAKENRNRANVLILGDALPESVVTRVQTQLGDEVNFHRPVQLDGEAWLGARTWHAVVIGLAAGEVSADDYARRVQTLAQRVKTRGLPIVWASVLPVASTEVATAVRFNDAGRTVARAEGAEVADLYAALVPRTEAWRAPGGGLTELGIERSAETLAGAVKRALLRRSTPWAELPAGEKRDPAKLLAEPASLAKPIEMAEAKGATAMIFRAKEGEWQFNLHSFIAHHDGKFWAVWSSGRVNEDSSSQFIRYATSVDGLTWSESAVLAPDPDGESGPWRWMASGVYVDGGKLFALGSLNQGNGPKGGPWSEARLVRFEWTGAAWKEQGVVAENCVVYFPPLKIEGRDFFVWRDSRAHFFTAYAPSGTDRWEVTRMPGPGPDYRMSETGAFVDPEGVVHLIIRDQGYTHRLYHALSYDAGATWTIPVKTNYPDAASKNMVGRLSNGWYYLINNPNAAGANGRDPLAISFSRDGWSFSAPLALRKDGPPLRFKGGAKGPHSFQYSHAIEHAGKLWVIYATNKEDIEVSAFPLESFGLGR